MIIGRTIPIATGTQMRLLRPTRGEMRIAPAIFVLQAAESGELRIVTSFVKADRLNRSECEPCQVYHRAQL